MAQILLFDTVTPSEASIFDALMELTSRDLPRMLFSRRIVFLPFTATKGCLSEKVLFRQPGLLQNIFLVVTNNTTCFPCIGRS